MRTYVIASRVIGPSAGWAFGPRSVEVQFACAVPIAWNAQILCMAQVRAPFPCVIAKEVSPIVDHLELVLFLVQRTITAAHAQGVANIEPTRAIDVEKWNSRCRLVHMQAGNARIGRGRRAC